jgi:hypothetical protein
MTVRFVQPSPLSLGISLIRSPTNTVGCPIIAAPKISPAIINDFATEVSES